MISKIIRMVERGNEIKDKKKIRNNRTRED